MLEQLKHQLSTLKYKYLILIFFTCGVVYGASNFKDVNVNGNISVTGTVDGRDLSTDGGTLDSLDTILGDITAAEADQLENIGSNIIGSSQWGFLASLNQDVSTGGTPSFSSLFLDEEIEFTQIVTPSNPPAGSNKLYFKSDNKLYSLTSAGVETEIGSGGGGANTTLSNLTNPTAINQSLLPSPSVTYSLGSTSTRWAAVHSQDFFGDLFRLQDISGSSIYGLLGTFQTTPSGVTNSTAFLSGPAMTGPLSVYTVSNATADANATKDLRLETGNKTAGTGDSGGLYLQTGTSAGGSRGSVFINEVSLGAASNGYVWTLQDSATGEGAWAAAGGGGANTALSNLDATTDLNSQLIFNPLTSPNAGMKTQNDGSSENINVTSGDASSVAGTSGYANISTGTATNSGGQSGDIRLLTGTASQQSGQVRIETNTVSAGAGITGDIIIGTGSTSGGQTRGKIYLQDGTQGTSGHVWTSTGVNGEGAWAAASGGANTTLSNLTSPTAINQDLIFNLTTPVIQSQNASGNTEDTELKTGDSSAGNSGIMTISSGEADQNSGDVLIKSGNATVDDSGNITLQTGAAGTNRGTIRFDEDSLSSASNGYVWKLQDNATGRGAWISESTVGSVAIDSIDNTDSPYALTSSFDLITADSSGGAITIDLPAANTVTGIVFTVKKISTDFTAITIDPNGAETIEDESTTTVNTYGESVRFVSNGSEYFILDRKIPSTWTSYTPTFTGFGTASGVSFYYSRDGANLKVSGVFTSGTSTATEAQISLPSGLTIASFPSAISNAGMAGKSVSGTATFYVLKTGGDSFVNIGYVNAAGAIILFARNANTFLDSGETMSVDFSVPISGWKGN